MYLIQKQQLLAYSLVIAATLLLLSILLPKTIHAATIEVNSTADTQANDGECTLREAIVSANTNTVSGGAANECVAGDAGADTLAFNIAGSGVKTIELSSSLPAVTEQLTINGYTQTGASENTAASPQPLDGTILIEVNFNYGSGNGMTINASNVVIKGLAIFSLSTTKNDSFIYVDASGFTFQGNYIGVRADGMTRVDSSTGSDRVKALFFDSDGDNCTFGGTSPANRNIVASLSGTQGGGNVRFEGDNCTVQGNYFGIAKDGITDIGGTITDINNFNEITGYVLLGGSGHTLGGDSDSERNLLSGATGAQLAFTGTGNTAQGNYIGTDYTGTKKTNIINGAGVILTANASENIVGGASAGEGNIIDGVKGAGVIVNTLDVEDVITLTPNKNAILGNSIKNVGVIEYDNFGDSNMGIDLFVQVDETGDFAPEYFISQGPTSNDVGDGDTGPNGYINTPVLKTAQQIGNQLTITYDLDADDAEEPANEYRVEFFANGESSIFGYGPGETYLGSTTVTPGADKTAVLTVSGDHTNKALSSTTTAVDSTTASGFGSTSEFSKNISIGSATDYDADGIADAIENAGPNGGDGNGDGTQDYLQPTVTTYQSGNGTYSTLSTTGCSENGTVSSFSIANAYAVDNGYVYPYDLTNFTLNCSRGDTVNVKLIVHDSTDPNLYLPRKYNPNTNSFTTVAGATVGTTTVGSTNPLLLTYSITDGGSYDDDGEANGVIVDPIGLATESPALANTGADANLVLVAAIITGLVGLGLLTRELPAKPVFGNNK